MELLPHIMFYHTAYMKKRFMQQDINTSGLTQLILEVIAPEILVHMISLDMKIDYDDALTILYDSKARLYGEQLDVEEILELLYPKRANRTRQTT